MQRWLSPLLVSRSLILAWLALGLHHEALAGPGLSRTKDGALQLEGKPFRGIGVNYYDLFVRSLENPSRTNAYPGFTTLREAGIPFARFSAGGYWPRDWSLYQTNSAAHFARLDAVVRAAEKEGLGLIPSLFWMLSTVPDLMGEPTQAWGDVHSRTHAFLRRYTREVVTRYRNSKAIWAWEFGNEYNLAADLPNAADHRPPVVPSLGTPAARTPADELTHAHMRTALKVFAEEVRAHDRTRLIISGNAFPRPSAWHQIQEHSWKKDSDTQFAEVLAADNPDPMDSLSVRAYDIDHDVGRLAQAAAAARAQRKPLFVGEFGVPGPITDDTRVRFTQILNALESERVPLSALWVFDFAGQSADWNVAPDNGRGWQLNAIGELNRRWRAETSRRK